MVLWEAIYCCGHHPLCPDGHARYLGSGWALPQSRDSTITACLLAGSTEPAIGSSRCWQHGTEPDVYGFAARYQKGIACIWRTCDCGPGSSFDFPFCPEKVVLYGLFCHLWEFPKWAVFKSFHFHFSIYTVIFVHT